MMTTVDEIREQQKAAWNKFAPGWRKWDRKWMNFFGPIGQAVIEGACLRPDSQVLDVATGTGEPGLTAAKLASQGKVVGTDISEEMVAIANQTALERGISNYSAQATDGLTQPFPDGSFDAVMCRFGIMFFPDPQQGVHEMARVLKPNSRLSLSVWAKAEENPWSSLIGKTVFDELNIPSPPPDSPGIFRFGTPGSAKTLVEKAGFQDVRETPIEGTVTFGSSEEYWTVLTEVAAPIATALGKANDEQRRRIKARVEAVSGKYSVKDGLKMPWRAYVVTGCR